MEDDDPNVRPWDELIPDTLGLIFQRLPLDEILNVVPSVCKSWAKAVRGPYCWQEIDIEDWSRYRRPDSLDRILLLLIGRSCGSLRKLCVYGLASEMSLSLIADNAKCLQILRLPGSEISGSMVEQVAVKLSSLTCLDLSYCTKIGAPALEAFGKNCKLLTCLQRNMHPWDVAAIMKDDEAYAISATMPQLKHLELAYLNITTDGAVRILKSCRELELLDIRGCWSVKINEKYLKDRSKLQVVGPLVVDGSGKVKESVDFYPGSSSFWAWGFGEMDEYDEDGDQDGMCDVSFAPWDDVHEMEDLGLVSYDDVYGYY
ncbi:F-box protein FBW2-like [Chenopodium quinoa]|uniref:F-box protein FBW2-like n=1 Tax=Chenopodium quinoa TaxID=63459 RepID=UPI000B78AD08|nr:F-box protein FBW2-like [Chenopodium quinoa]